MNSQAKNVIPLQESENISDVYPTPQNLDQLVEQFRQRLQLPKQWLYDNNFQGRNILKNLIIQFNDARFSEHLLRLRMTKEFDPENAVLDLWSDISDRSL